MNCAVAGLIGLTIGFWMSTWFLGWLVDRQEATAAETGFIKIKNAIYKIERLKP